MSTHQNMEVNIKNKIKVSLNHLNENTNADTNNNGDSLFRLGSSGNEHNYSSQLNINQNSTANQLFSMDNNNTMTNINAIINNNFSNTGSLFEDVEEEYQNDEQYLPEISYGSNVDEVFDNLTYIINAEKYITIFKF